MLKKIDLMARNACLLSLLWILASGKPARAQSGSWPSEGPIRKVIVPTLKDDPPASPRPLGKQISPVRGADAPTREPNVMKYYGGPLLIGMKHLYFIWYGDWSKDTDAIQILQDFANNLGGSPYFNINTTYYDAKGRHVQNEVVLAGSIFDHYSHGKALEDGDMMYIPINAIRSGLLPLDPMGVYFVLTSADVQQNPGFCSQYCAWHFFASMGEHDIPVRFAFVGNPDRCPRACSAQTTTPNGNMGADAMASLIAHELEESVTDPEITGWRTPYLMENGDLCAWKFGSTQTLPTGARYNMTLGRRNYLIQQNWVNETPGYCALSYH